MPTELAVWRQLRHSPRVLAEAWIRRATDRLFRHLEVEPRWLREVEAAVARGPVVYVLRNVSALDYLALDHLTQRYRLPRIGFVNELPAALTPSSSRWSRSKLSEVAELERALGAGQSAALFLQRPPQRPGGLPGRSEGAALLAALLARQSEADRDITMVPQLLLWTRRAERRGFSIVDTVFGPVDFPGELRQLAQIVINYHRGELRAGEPLSLSQFLAEQPGEPREVLVRRLSWALLRKVDRERRAVIGPAYKPPDRMREEMVKSPKLQAVIRELAGPNPEQLGRMENSARDMLRELATIPDPETARSLEAIASQVLERLFAGIDVDEEGIERIREAAREGSVVLLPSHKSHVDYIVLSYVLRQRSLQLPVIAAGDNLAFFPLGPVLRRAGAFFIRRSFRGDRLYTAVVDAYVRRLLRAGWIIEFFLEGGRSRTGKLLPPMLGLLNMVVAAALPLERRKVHFFPISIGYERLMEESAFARELGGGEKRAEDASQLLAAGKLLADRFGRLNVQIGRPIELGALRAELGLGDAKKATPAKRRAIVKRLAHQVMDEINRVTAVTPGALVALVLLGHGRRGMAWRDLVDQAMRAGELMQRSGARIAPSLLPPGATRLREQGIAEALRLYLKSGLVEQHVPGEMHDDEKERSRLYTGTDVIFTVPDPKRVRLDFAKNHIIHFLVDRALIAAALGKEPIAPGELRARVLSLSRLFKYEFMFRADAPFDRIFEEVLAAMIDAGELASGPGDTLAPGPGHDGLDGAGWIAFYAAVVKNFIEAYAVAAKSLEHLLKAPLGHKELALRAIKTGQRMFLRGEIERAEAVARPMLENAIDAFVDQGYLIRKGDELSLAQSFASPAGVQAVEARLAAFLSPR